MAKRILFVFRHAPYGSALAREGLDALLAAAVYEQEIAALFLNDGVFQLLDGQNTDSSGLKNHQRIASALPLYGVDQIYVDADSLSHRNLSIGVLAVPAQTLPSPQDTRELMQSYDHLLSF